MKSLAIIWALALISIVGIYITLECLTMPAGAAECYGPCQQQQDQKYDGGCQPTDTAGRCADKCPANTTLQGYQADGQAICQPVITQVLGIRTYTPPVIIPGFAGK